VKTAHDRGKTNLYHGSVCKICKILYMYIDSNDGLETVYFYISYHASWLEKNRRKKCIRTLRYKKINEIYHAVFLDKKIRKKFIRTLKC